VPPIDGDSREVAVRRGWVAIVHPKLCRRGVKDLDGLVHELVDAHLAATIGHAHRDGAAATGECIRALKEARVPPIERPGQGSHARRGVDRHVCVAHAQARMTAKQHDTMVRTA
jgi:hypothetical protein